MQSRLHGDCHVLLMENRWLAESIIFSKMQATAYGKKSAITSQNKVQYSQTQQHVLNSIFRADGPCPDLLPTYQLKPQSAAYAIGMCCAL